MPGEEHPSDQPQGESLLGPRPGGASSRTPPSRLLGVGCAALAVVVLVVGFLTNWSLSAIGLAVVASVGLVLLAVLIRRPPPTRLETREKNRTRRDRW